MNDVGPQLMPDMRRWSPNLDLQERISLLSAYINYWHSPPNHKSHTESLRLPPFLPAPVRWLYQTIAAHTNDAFASNHGGWTDGTPVVIYYWLKRPSDLVVNSSGIVEFLNENQGVYQIGTLTGSDDPEVFIWETEVDGWTRHADRLSDFVLLTIIFEQTLQGPHLACGSFPADDFNVFVTDLVRVGIGNVSWMSADCVSIHQGDGFVILAGSNPDGTMYLQAVAKTQAALEMLKQLGVWEHWWDR